MEYRITWDYNGVRLDLEDIYGKEIDCNEDHECSAT
jgi:hypothetical protein